MAKTLEDDIDGTERRLNEAGRLLYSEFVKTLEKSFPNVGDNNGDATRSLFNELRRYFIDPTTGFHLEGPLKVAPDTGEPKTSVMGNLLTTEIKAMVEVDSSEKGRVTSVEIVTISLGNGGKFNAALGAVGTDQLLRALYQGIRAPIVSVVGDLNRVFVVRESAGMGFRLILSHGEGSDPGVAARATKFYETITSEFLKQVIAENGIKFLEGHSIDDLDVELQVSATVVSKAAAITNQGTRVGAEPALALLEVSHLVREQSSAPHVVDSAELFTQGPNNGSSELNLELLFRGLGNRKPQGQATLVEVTEPDSLPALSTGFTEAYWRKIEGACREYLAAIRGQGSAIDLTPAALLESVKGFGGVPIDPLTGCLAKGCLLDLVTHVVSEADSNSYYVEFDLANVGGLNNVLDRRSADTVIGGAISKLEEFLRREKVVYDIVRKGGDEFAVVIQSYKGNIEGLVDQATGQVNTYLGAIGYSTGDGPTQTLSDLAHPKAAQGRRPGVWLVGVAGSLAGDEGVREQEAEDVAAQVVADVGEGLEQAKTEFVPPQAGTAGSANPPKNIYRGFDVSGAREVPNPGFEPHQGPDTDSGDAQRRGSST